MAGTIKPAEVSIMKQYDKQFKEQAGSLSLSAISRMMPGFPG
ncbi:hypothetical protein [Desulfoscipio geothermicus]|nr:hypothetical protein [Desulfoscipio geothermicus]